MLREYKTLASVSTAEITEKRSRFIASVCPSDGADSAADFVSAVRAKHHDARHNVYAYRMRDEKTVKYSDDGEPQGTAGQPILKVLESFGVYDCAAVVTRYFGGILLGTGGLQRAYSRAAELALEQAEIITMVLHRRTLLECGYEMYGRLSAVTEDCGGRINTADFSDRVRAEILVPDDAAERFAKQIYSASAGKIEPVFSEYVYSRSK